MRGEHLTYRAPIINIRATTNSAVKDGHALTRHHPQSGCWDLLPCVQLVIFPSFADRRWRALLRVEGHSSSELSHRRHTVVSLRRGIASSACGCTVYGRQYIGLSHDGDGVTNSAALVLVMVMTVGFLSFSATMYDIVLYNTIGTISYHNAISPFVHSFVSPLCSSMTMNGLWIEIRGGYWNIWRRCDVGWPVSR